MNAFLNDLSAPLTTPRRGWHDSIRFQMIAGFVLLFIPILLGLEFFSISGIPWTRWHGFQGIEIAQGMNHLSLVADTKKERLLAWVEERKEDARIIAHNPLLDRLFHPGPGDGRINAHAVTANPESPFRDILEWMRLIQKNNAIYQSVAIADIEDGAILLSTNTASPGERIDLSRLDRSMRARDEAILDIPETAGATELIRIIHPIIPGKEPPTALVILTAGTEALFGPLMHSGDGLGHQGEAFLFDRNRAILTPLKHPLPDGTTARPGHYQLQSPAAHLAIDGKEGVMDDVDYRGREVLAGYRHLPFAHGQEWGFVVQMDREELLGFLNDEIRIVMTITATAFLLLVILSWWMSSRLSRPLIRLGEVAQRFSKGEMNVRAHIDERNEIGALAHAFDRMADAVQRSMEHLSEQTQKLNQSLERQAQHQAIQERILKLSQVLVAARSLEDLLGRGLDVLLADTQSLVGAIYLRDEEDDSRFLLAHALGMAHRERLQPFLDAHEGGIGLAIQRRAPFVLENIPQDTPFLHATIAGKLLPRSIVHVPLLFQERILGVLALASCAAVTNETMEFLKVGQSLLSMALADALSHAKTERMAQRLQHANQELESSNQELQAQSRQLQAQTEELHRQTDELRQQARELELKQGQVEKADRLKSEFLSNMSHELRTPLNSVLTLSQLMIRKGVGKNPGKEREYLEVIERNGRQLLNLINDILDLSKIESGQMELTLGDMSPAETIDRVVETVRPLAEAKGLTLTVHAAPVPPIHGDEDKIRQILLNLLSNAIKFTTTGGVEIGLGQDGNQLFFWVRDSGPGIAGEHLESIFNAFTQVDGSASRHHEGTGLGLTISRRLTDLIGGTLRVQSSPGNGATFTLTLPLDSGKERVGIQNQISPPPPPQQPPRTLVVDDNEIARLQIRSVLEETGHEVIETSGGMEALKAVEEGRVPDLVILDLMMPGMDGFQVVHHLRTQKRTAELPILILTAKELNPEERKLLRHHRVTELIQKGRLNRDQLRLCIGNLLTVPAAEAPPVPAASPPRPTDPPILIVEDKPDNLLALTALLDDLGHRYITAGNGREAIDKTRTHKPGLVLMDMQLPVMNGFDATRSIKADPMLRNIPVIAVTASAMKGDQERMLAAGCDDYISKPIDMRRLATLMNKWLPAAHG
ncbi:MAG: response regulator [Magnetococcales bacterium]|nr:response regulator [Magnetococcales bacterium]